MEGYQKLTRNGLKMAFFSMLKTIMETEELKDDQKIIFVKSIQMAYCILRAVDDDIADALNEQAENEMLMTLMNMLILEPEDIMDFFNGDE